MLHKNEKNHVPSAHRETYSSRGLAMGFVGCPPAARTLRPHQLDLLRRTVANDCTSEEFDLFIEAASHYGLDPFRGQILPLVFSKDRLEKRRLVIVVGLAGQRIIAQRCGNYRPASTPTKFRYDKRRIGPTNPLGLVSAQITLFQQDNLGSWFPVVGEAFWDELAPIRDEWAENQESGRWERTGRQILAGGEGERGSVSPGWHRMPRLMLQKCATMQALRAGWPEAVAGLYAEEEMDKPKILDLMASEIVEREREERRLHAIAGKDAITVCWGEWGLENVPLGQFADRVLAWIEAPGRTAEEISNWKDANRDPLRLFWAKAPSDALALKKVLETKSQSAPDASVSLAQRAGGLATPTTKNRSLHAAEGLGA